MWLRYSKRKMVELFSNSVDPDQTPHSVAPDLGLHCLPITHWLLWVKYIYSFFQDGVMVLSATHRFRKKYVTTLLYKPI